MQVSSASASAIAGLARAGRSLDAAAAAVGSAFAPAEVPDVSTPTRSGSAGSDPLDGVTGGDPIAPFVQMIAAQRAFSASLVVLRTDAEMQRSFIESVR